MSDPPARAPLVVGAALALLALSYACATDTSGLEQRPGRGSDETRPSATAEPDASAAVTDASAGAAPTTPAVAPQPPQPPPDDEPIGRWSLMLLHSVVDAERLGFCLVQTRADETSVYPRLLPDEDGLRFGQAMVLERPAGLDLTQQELQLVGVRLDSSSTAPRTCVGLLEEHDGVSWQEAATEWQWRVIGDGVREPRMGPLDGGLDAGARTDGGDGGAAAPVAPEAERPDGSLSDAAVGHDAAAGFALGDAAVSHDAAVGSASAESVRRLVRWPAGSLATEYSYLLAVSGCFGGASLGESLAACGEAQARQGSSLVGRFTRLSRKRRFDSLSVQVFNASAAQPEVGVRSVPGEQDDGLYFILADRVAFGQALPPNPVRGVAVADLGAPLESVTLEIYGSPRGEVLESFQWGQVLEQSPIEQLSDARPLVLVFMGAPNPRAPAWANRASLVALPSDPLLDE